MLNLINPHGGGKGIGGALISWNTGTARLASVPAAQLGSSDGLWSTLAFAATRNSLVNAAVLPHRLVMGIELG